MLAPEIDVPVEWRPDTTVTVRVSEASGRPMIYTLAVVDEGLLGLTSFETPDLHDHFYSKEALGVSTWDIFDDVAGAYAAELERLLALGGDDAVEIQEQERSRFPPVVRFLGPFALGRGERRTHSVNLPEYIGQVRAMVVAGRDGAYGSASESVFVRQPLSLLATVPRVVGPGEEIAVPVALFAMEEGIEQATVTVDASAQFEVVGSASETVSFGGAEEQMARLRLRAGERPRPGRPALRRRGGRAHRQLGDRAPDPQPEPGDHPSGADPDRARRAVEHRCGSARDPRDQFGDPRGDAASASQSGSAPGIPDALPARVPGADCLCRLPPAVPAPAGAPGRGGPNRRRGECTGGHRPRAGLSEPRRAVSPTGRAGTRPAAPARGG